MLSNWYRLLRRVLLAMTIMFFVVGPVRANEGIVNLRGLGRGACYSASMFMDGAYRVMTTCRELITAMSPEKNRYILWYEDTLGKTRMVGEIVNGKNNGFVAAKFIRLFVTTEETDYPEKPSTEELLSGYIQPIDFGKNIPVVPIVTAVVTPTSTLTPVVLTVTPTQKIVTPRPTTTSSQSGLGSALSTIFKVALFGFGLLLVIVGVFSFLQRRRSL